MLHLPKTVQTWCSKSGYLRKPMYTLIGVILILYIYIHIYHITWYRMYIYIVSYIYIYIYTHWTEHNFKYKTIYLAYLLAGVLFYVICESTPMSGGPLAASPPIFGISPCQQIWCLLVPPEFFSWTRANDLGADRTNFWQRGLVLWCDLCRLVQLLAGAVFRGETTSFGRCNMGMAGQCLQELGWKHEYTSTIPLSCLLFFNIPTMFNNNQSGFIY